MADGGACLQLAHQRQKQRELSFGPLLGKLRHIVRTFFNSPLFSTKNYSDLRCAIEYPHEIYRLIGDWKGRNFPDVPSSKTYARGHVALRHRHGLLRALWAAGRESCMCSASKFHAAKLTNLSTRQCIKASCEIWSSSD